MSWKLKSLDVCQVLRVMSLPENSFEFLGYGTDTRKDLSNKLFIALEGESFDAHDYLEKAVEQGAAGLVVHCDISEEFRYKLLASNPELVIIEVEDTLLALQALATDWRDRCGFKVIGITGTNGKTTTKEFVAQILSAKKKVYYSEGSLNNHWGVPFTLLNASKGDEWVICEMGMNSPGEIARLCEIAKPELVGVTFVGRGHLEGMGSVEKIALEKSQIYSYSNQSGCIFNIDNFYTKMMKNDFFKDGDVLFGDSDAAQVQFRCVSNTFDQMTISGRINETEFMAKLSIYGEHNVTNLMSAASFCLLAGMSEEEIINQLPNVKMAWGRNQIERLGDVTVVFDGYNANPESMDAFLSNASKQEPLGKKHLVLGEMLELGEEAESLHKELGMKVRSFGFESVHFFGSSFKHFLDGFNDGQNLDNLIITSTYEVTVANKIKSMIQANDAVFIKASRGVHLERFLELLKSDG